MFRALSLIFILLFQQNIYAAGSLSQCEAYLYNLEVIKGNSLYENTLKSLKEYQMEFRHEQQVALIELRGSLRARSMNFGFSFLEAIPALDPKTLDHLKAWASAVEVEDMDVLQGLIADDPYLKWLDKNWRSTSLADEEEIEDSFLKTLIFKNDDQSPFQEALDSTLWGYLTRHLKYSGPMKIRPELAIYRVMRNHDPKLSPHDLELIDLVLGYEKQKFVLNKFVHEMENFVHGSDEEWDQYDNAIKVNRRLMALKQTLREWFPDYDEYTFRIQKSNMTHIRRSAGDDVFFAQDLRYTFEDYIISKASVFAFDKEFLELKEEYFRLKAILFATSISQNVETLNEELAVQVHSLRHHFMY